MTDRSPDAALRESWVANAAAWTRAVRSGSIASRRLATDAAIVEAVMSARVPQPRRALDLGCGEGWLARALAAHGIDVTGIDASPPLIASARQMGGGRFVVLDYDELAGDPGKVATGYDAAVANFALFGEDTAPMLRAVRQSLAADGVLVVQTIHPLSVAPPYRDGWRTEDFRGFGESEWREMPWFFRTLGSRVALLRAAGYALDDMREPLHPETGLPLSLLMVAKPVAPHDSGGEASTGR